MKGARFLLAFNAFTMAVQVALVTMTVTNNDTHIPSFVIGFGWAIITGLHVWMVRKAWTDFDKANTVGG